MKEPHLQKRLVPQRDAAKILNVSEYWLERQRWLKTGPKYVKIGGAVRYKVEDLEEYIRSRTVTPSM